MEISGAIFDCDGTLVDSLTMRRGANRWLYEANGLDADAVDLVALEALSIWDMCAYMHDELGCEATAEELYEQLCAHVRDAYRNEVEIFPGAREFVAELAAAGIPMIIASSTPVRELRCALEAHGLDGYFRDLVSTEDVGGRDKEFPDVYLEAQRRLADCYRHGQGVSQSKAQAAYWYRKAAEQDDAGTQEPLGSCREEGGDQPKEARQGLDAMRKAAEEGNAEAQYRYAECCRTGEGVPQDDAQAAVWFRKAAEQGYAAAQNALGRCYFFEKGLAKDHAQAALWFSKAAEQGYAEAQYALGASYKNGLGVLPQDDAQAAYWFRMAAEQGHEAAREALARESVSV